MSFLGHTVDNLPMDNSCRSRCIRRFLTGDPNAPSDAPVFAAKVFNKTATDDDIFEFVDAKRQARLARGSVTEDGAPIFAAVEAMILLAMRDG